VNLAANHELRQLVVPVESSPAFLRGLDELLAGAVAFARQPLARKVRWRTGATVLSIVSVRQGRV